MQKLLTVIKNTVLFTIRSYLVISLLILITLASLIVPFLVVGDSTISSYVTLAIQYTLYSERVILIISAIFFSCYLFCFDLEHYQMHMVAVKPVARITLWLGKLVGVFIVYSVLLVIGYIIFYGVLNYNIFYHIKGEKELKKLRDEVLIGRIPVHSDITNVFKKYKSNLSNAIKDLEKNNENGKREIDKLKSKIFYQTLAQEGRVPPNGYRIFLFNNIEKGKKLTLKYKIYVGSLNVFATQYKPKIVGFWETKSPERGVFVPVMSKKEIYSNIFYQIAIPSKYIGKNGCLILKFNNLSKRDSIFFQLYESPVIMVHQTSFSDNYIRSLVVSVLALLFVIILGAVFGSIFSYPIAVFSVISYLIIGGIGNYILQNNNPFSTESIYKRAISAIASIGDFNGIIKVSEGEYISYKFILWDLIVKIILLREFPLIFLAIFVYSRRELGLIIKK